MAQRSAAEQQFDSAVGQVMALGQTYPQLSSSNNFLNLQQNLADTEDKLAFARQYYNDAVATLNRSVTTIPWMFVAGAAGVQEREYYQARAALDSVARHPRLARCVLVFAGTPEPACRRCAGSSTRPATR